MNPFENVIQLDESIEYPAGYNAVTVEGSGDERSDKIFSSIAISRTPGVVTSDGAEMVSCTVTIKDYNNSNPFLFSTETEEVSTDNPFEISTGKYIQTLIGIWEDADKLHPVTYIAVQGSKIRISDSFVSYFAPPSYGNGLYYDTVWVEYTSGASITVATGLQEEDRWWETTPTISDDVNDVDGTFYRTATKDPVYDGEVPISNTAGSSAIVTFYFIPEAGASGTATINVEYDNAASSTSVQVLSGGTTGIEISLEANPSSIGIDGGQSTITAEVTDSAGAPVTGQAVTFTVKKGPVYFYGSTSVMPSTVAGEIEDVETSVGSSTALNDTFSLSHPIVKINSIVLRGNGTFIWNEQATINGSEVQLVGQTFPDTTTSPITVNYDYGGVAVTSLKTTTAAVVDDEVIISAQVGTVNALLVMSVGEEDSASGGAITINADPSSVARDESATIYISVTQDDVPCTGTVRLEAAPYGHVSPTSASLGSHTFTDATGSVQNKLQVEVDYPIKSGTTPTVKWNDVSYSVESVSGTTINLISPGLPVPGGDCVVTYIADGMATATYTPSATQGEYDAYVTATYTFTIPDTGGMTEEISEYTTISISDEDSSSGLDISLDAAETSIAFGESTTIVVTATTVDADNNTIAYSGSVSMRVAPTGYGSISPTTLTLGYKSVSNVTGTINDFDEVSSPYRIKVGTLPTVTYGGSNYAVSSVDDDRTTIHLSSSLPVPGGDCTLAFTAEGYGEATYKAKSSGDDYDAYVVASSGDVSSNCTISVTAGGGATGITIDIDADPTSIGKKETSTITISAAQDDIPLNGVGIKLQCAPYGTTSPTTVTVGTKSLTGVEGTINGFREVTAPYYPKVGSKPTISITGFGSYTASSVEGRTLNFASDLPIPGGNCTIDMTADGYGEATYTPSESRAPYDGYVIASYSGESAQCSISISKDDTGGGGGDGGGTENLTLSANPTSCKKTDTSIITVTAPGQTGSVSMSVAEGKGSCSPSSVTLGDKSITNADGNITSKTTVTVSYNIKSGSTPTVTYNSTPYGVASVSGTTITLSGTGLPTPGGKCKVNYTTTGYGETTYNPSQTETVPYTAYVMGELGDQAADCTVDVTEDGNPPGGGDGEDKTVALTISADPPSLTGGQSSEIKYSVTVGGVKRAGKSVSISIETSALGVTCGSGGFTGSDGTGTTTLSTTTSSQGSVQVKGVCDGVNAGTSVTVNLATEAYETEQKNYAHITGELDPALPRTSIPLLEINSTGGCSVAQYKLGAAENTDEYGGTDDDPFLTGPLVLLVSITGYDANKITDVSIQGAELKTEYMSKLPNSSVPPQDRELANGESGDSKRWDYSSLYLALTWPSELANTSSPFEVQVVTSYDDSPIEGASVQISTFTATTNDKGVAKFTGGIPVGEHDIFIHHPNFKDNQQGVPGGSGSYDSDLTNDKFTVVQGTSGKKYMLKKMNADIYITLTVIKE